MQKKQLNRILSSNLTLLQESKPQLITAHDLPMNESEFYDSGCIYNVQDFQNKDSHYI